MESYWPQEIMITTRGLVRQGSQTFKSTSHAPVIVRRFVTGPPVSHKYRSLT